MALIKCHECSGQVSDHARTCPQCGAPVIATIKRRQKAALVNFCVRLGLGLIFGIIVWILPVDYYETLVAKIPPSLLVAAEQLVSCPPPAKPPEKPKEITAPPAAKPVVKPPVLRSFKITGTLMNVQGKSRSVNLGPWPAQDYENSTTKLLQDTRFFEAMRIKLDEQASLEEYSVGLLIKLGKKGEGVWVNVD